jgi:hypothetical protein
VGREFLILTGRQKVNHGYRQTKEQHLGYRGGIS